MSVALPSADMCCSPVTPANVHDCNLVLCIQCHFLIAERTLELARRQSSLCTTQLSIYFYNIVPLVLPVSV